MTYKRTLNVQYLEPLLDVTTLRLYIVSLNGSLASFPRAISSLSMTHFYDDIHLLTHNEHREKFEVNIDLMSALVNRKLRKLC